MHTSISFTGAPPKPAHSSDPPAKRPRRGQTLRCLFSFSYFLFFFFFSFFFFFIFFFIVGSQGAGRAAADDHSRADATDTGGGRPGLCPGTAEDAVPKTWATSPTNMMKCACQRREMFPSGGHATHRLRGKDAGGQQNKQGLCCTGCGRWVLLAGPNFWLFHIAQLRSGSKKAPVVCLFARLLSVTSRPKC